MPDSLYLDKATGLRKPNDFFYLMVLPMYSVYNFIIDRIATDWEEKGRVLTMQGKTIPKDKDLQNRVLPTDIPHYFSSEHKLGLALLIFFALSGCLRAGTSEPTSLPMEPSALINPAPTSTETLWPTWTLTPSPTSTLTNLPSPTHSFSPDEWGNTPMPTTHDQISSRNADQVQFLSRWGKGTINRVTYSPDGNLLAVASSIGIFLRDARTLKEIRYINSNYNIRSVAFSPTGRTLASGSYDSAIRLWRVADGKLSQIFTGHADQITSLTYSPDGGTLFSGSLDGTIRFWDVEKGDLIRTIKINRLQVTGIAVSHNGQIVAAGSNDNSVRLFRVSDGSLIHLLVGHENYSEHLFNKGEMSLSFSPDDQLLAESSTSDSTIIIWQVDTGKVKLNLGPDQIMISDVLFSPDGQFIASASRIDGSIFIYTVSSGSLYQKMMRDGQRIAGISFSPDGKTLAAGYSDTSISQWRLSDGALVQSQGGQDFNTSVFSLSTDGQLIASGYYTGPIRIWRVKDGNLMLTLGDGTSRFISIALSPDGQTIASSAEDGSIIFWDVINGTPKRTFRSPNDKKWNIYFAQNGNTLVITNGTTMQTWRVSDGTLLMNRDESEHISQLSVSPDGELIASALFDHTVSLWKMAGTAPLRKLGKPNFNDPYIWERVVFSPDGTKVATGDESGNISIWRVSDGTVLRVINSNPPFTKIKFNIESIAFSPDGTVLATGSGDGIIRLWQVSDGKLVNMLKGHTSSVENLAFLPDGSILVSSAPDGTIRFWGIP
jgi:WD40 repeat protein